MNDVVFVMTNSRLMKKKDVRKTKDYNIDDFSSGDEWNGEENETNSSLDDLDEDIIDGLDEDILFEVGEDDASRGGVATSMNDLEVPPIANNDEGHGGDDINENEDHLEDDDYPMINIYDTFR